MKMKKLLVALKFEAEVIPPKEVMSESDRDKDFPRLWRRRKVRVGNQELTYTGSVFIYENDLQDEILTEL